MEMGQALKAFASMKNDCLYDEERLNVFLKVYETLIKGCFQGFWKKWLRKFFPMSNKKDDFFFRLRASKSNSRETRKISHPRSIILGTNCSSNFQQVIDLLIDLKEEEHRGVRVLST